MEKGEAMVAVLDLEMAGKRTRNDRRALHGMRRIGESTIIQAMHTIAPHQQRPAFDESRRFREVPVVPVSRDSQSTPDGFLAVETN